ncbi:DUF5105 domain-containing protein [Clostridium sp. MSJ-11]|uniref:DUF5105 domain-containing protein n=1 Tax=Clostridium mobile TaxID=2841512 RepID=A0ABS6EF92_9CLOT|nr:DUF5105 domain-containing protein [Clostridium mobile]MBU5483442.1 DUF5105 domain-containing protein [Clostridium mobile]
MKKGRKSLLLSLVLIVISIMVIGCSSKPKVAADETAKILFDFYIKGDQEALAKIKLPKEQIEEISKIQKDETMKTIKNNFAVAGLKVSDAQVNEIYTARASALKKLSAETEIVSENDESADVKLKTTYINEIALDEKAATNAIQEVEKLNITNQEEILNKLTEVYIKNLINEYKNVQPSSDLKEQTFKFEIKEKTWLPQDIETFSMGIVKLVLGME